MTDQQDTAALHSLAAGRPALVWRRQLADTETPVAAALKLEPFDPSRGVRWAADAAVAVEALVARVSDACTTHDIPARSAPLVEEWGQRHRTSERRLFRA